MSYRYRIIREWESLRIHGILIARVSGFFCYFIHPLVLPYPHPYIRLLFHLFILFFSKALSSLFFVAFLLKTEAGEKLSKLDGDSIWKKKMKNCICNMNFTNSPSYCIHHITCFSILCVSIYMHKFCFSETYLSTTHYTHVWKSAVISSWITCWDCLQDFRQSGWIYTFMFNS